MTGPFDRPLSDLTGIFDWARSNLTGTFDWVDLVVSINRSILSGWVSNGRNGNGRARCSFTSIAVNVICVYQQNGIQGSGTSSRVEVIISGFDVINKSFLLKRYN